jgi:type II secretory pathway component PulF
MIILTLLLILLLVYIYLGWKRPSVALTSCPFIAVILLITGFVTNSLETVISAAVISFATLITVQHFRRDVTETQWPREVARYLLIFAKDILILFFCIFCVFICVLTVMAFGPFGVFGLFFIFFLIGSIIAFNITSKRATAAYVISTIGSCIRQNLPLPMALELAGSRYKDKRSIILHRIKKWLVQGYSLSESIKRGYLRCPGYVVAMISAAEKIDQVPNAMKSIEANMRFAANERRKIRPVHPLYPVLVLCFTFLILSGIMVFVLPNFARSISEMTEGGRLPAITRFYMKVTNSIFHSPNILYIYAIIVVVLLVFIPVIIYIRLRPRRPDKPYFSSRISDFLKWHIPVLHWFERNYSLVQVVEMLRFSLSAGCTVNAAIAQSISLDVNNCFKKHLQNWLKKVERGDNIAAAVKSSNLGSPLAWAFDEQVNQGNTITILETLEKVYRSNYSYLVNLIRFITWPCIILLIGITVGSVVLAIFAPNIAVIQSLANTTTP